MVVKDSVSINKQFSINKYRSKKVQIVQFKFNSFVLVSKLRFVKSGKTKVFDFDVSKIVLGGITILKTNLFMC